MSIPPDSPIAASSSSLTPPNAPEHPLTPPIVPQLPRSAHNYSATVEQLRSSLEARCNALTEALAKLERWLDATPDASVNSLESLVTMLRQISPQTWACGSLEGLGKVEAAIESLESKVQAAQTEAEAQLLEKLLDLTENHKHEELKAILRHDICLESFATALADKAFATIPRTFMDPLRTALILLEHFKESFVDSNGDGLLHYVVRNDLKHTHTFHRHKTIPSYAMTNSNGESATLYALRSGKEEHFHFVRACATIDAFVQDNSGESALTYVIRHKRRDLLSAICTEFGLRSFRFDYGRKEHKAIFNHAIAAAIKLAFACKDRKAVSALQTAELSIDLCDADEQPILPKLLEDPDMKTYELLRLLFDNYRSSNANLEIPLSPTQRAHLILCFSTSENAIGQKTQKLLVSHPVDLSVVAPDGRRALDLALERLAVANTEEKKYLAGLIAEVTTQHPTLINPRILQHIMHFGPASVFRAWMEKGVELPSLESPDYCCAAGTLRVHVDILQELVQLASADGVVGERARALALTLNLGEADIGIDYGREQEAQRTLQELLPLISEAARFHLGILAHSGHLLSPNQRLTLVLLASDPLHFLLWMRTDEELLLLVDRLPWMHHLPSVRDAKPEHREAITKHIVKAIRSCRDLESTKYTEDQRRLNPYLTREGVKRPPVSLRLLNALDRNELKQVLKRLSTNDLFRIFLHDAHAQHVPSVGNRLGFHGAQAILKESPRALFQDSLQNLISARAIRSAIKYSSVSVKIQTLAAVPDIPEPFLTQLLSDSQVMQQLEAELARLQSPRLIELAFAHVPEKAHAAIRGASSVDIYTLLNAQSDNVDSSLRTFMTGAQQARNLWSRIHPLLNAEQLDGLLALVRQDAKWPKGWHPPRIQRLLFVHLLRHNFEQLSPLELGLALAYCKAKDFLEHPRRMDILERLLPTCAEWSREPMEALLRASSELCQESEQEKTRLIQIIESLETAPLAELISADAHADGKLLPHLSEKGVERAVSLVTESILKESMDSPLLLWVLEKLKDSPERQRDLMRSLLTSKLRFCNDLSETMTGHIRGYFSELWQDEEIDRGILATFIDRLLYRLPTGAKEACVQAAFARVDQAFLEANPTLTSRILHTADRIQSGEKQRILDLCVQIIQEFEETYVIGTDDPFPRQELVKLMELTEVEELAKATAAMAARHPLRFVSDPSPEAGVLLLRQPLASSELFTSCLKALLASKNYILVIGIIATNPQYLDEMDASMQSALQEKAIEILREFPDMFVQLKMLLPDLINQALTQADLLLLLQVAANQTSNDASLSGELDRLIAYASEQVHQRILQPNEISISLWERFARHSDRGFALFVSTLPELHKVNLLGLPAKLALQIDDQNKLQELCRALTKTQDSNLKEMLEKHDPTHTIRDSLKEELCDSYLRERITSVEKDIEQYQGLLQTITKALPALSVDEALHQEWILSERYAIIAQQVRQIQSEMIATSTLRFSSGAMYLQVHGKEPQSPEERELSRLYKHLGALISDKTKQPLQSLEKSITTKVREQNAQQDAALHSESMLDLFENPSDHLSSTYHIGRASHQRMLHTGLGKDTAKGNLAVLGSTPGLQLLVRQARVALLQVEKKPIFSLDAWIAGKKLCASVDVPSTFGESITAVLRRPFANRGFGNHDGLDEIDVIKRYLQQPKVDKIWEETLLPMGISSLEGLAAAYEKAGIAVQTEEYFHLEELLKSKPLQ